MRRILVVVLCLSFVQEVRAGSFLDHTVDSDATVGADCRTGSAADTLLRILICHKMISPVIYFLRLEPQHVAGTGHNTEVATFATLSVDVNSSYNFCHIV